MKNITLITALLGLATTIQAETISLQQFMDGVQATHPFFKKEALRAMIERQQQQRFLGAEDWLLSATPSFRTEETTEARFGAPEEVDNVHLNAALARKVWKTGGSLDLTFDHDYTDQSLGESTLQLPGGEGIDIGGPAEYYKNALVLSYAHPLLKNRGGGLDRLDYDLQGFTADATELQVVEAQESFLGDLASRFIDWAVQDSEQSIARQRLELAQQQLEQTRKKVDANIVDRVDLLRAQDAVIQARRTVGLAGAAWKASQKELAVLAGDASILEKAPVFDLYQRAELPTEDSAAQRATSRSRIMRQLRTRLAQVERQRDGLKDLTRPDLNLVLTGGLQDGDEDLGGAASFDRPVAGIALSYRYPLGNTTADADIMRVSMEHERVERELESAALDLEATVRSLLTRIRALEPVLDLNQEQIRTAAEKTGEELRLYDQGRNQLTFVIQSRDDEARAQLVLAQISGNYHKLVLAYRILADELLADMAGVPAR